MMRPPFSNVFFASGGPEAFLLPSSEIHIQNPVKRIAPVEFGQEGVKQGPDSTPLGGLGDTLVILRRTLGGPPRTRHEGAMIAFCRGLSRARMREG
jgi:hypothetical protein